VTVVYPGSGAIYTVRTPSLPLVTLAWTSEESLIAAGHDCQPILFSGSEAQGGWKQIANLDEGAAGGSSRGLSPTATGSSVSGSSSALGRPGRLHQNEAFARFKSADSRGVTAGQSAIAGGPSAAGGASGNTELYTVHQNTITSVRPFTTSPDGNTVESVSTSGVDGKLVIWGVPNVASLANVAQLSGRVGGMHLR
jgi:actin related protein 2/3 complex subunit 1A/1B